MTLSVLRIDSSMRNTDSVSRRLIDQVIETLKPSTLMTRDLLTTPIPQIDETWINASFTPADQRSPEQLEALTLSDQLVDEIQASDVVVIGAPIYNFGAPAALKAWIDQVARAGLTFQYSENGPVGLLEGKRAILVITSGGTAVDSPIDFATPHLRQVLGFIGITDVDVIAADSLMADQGRLEKANEKIAALAVA